MIIGGVGELPAGTITMLFSDIEGSSRWLPGSRRRDVENPGRQPGCERGRPGAWRSWPSPSPA